MHMGSTDIMRQIENLKREQVNNNTRIAQEQRNIDNYERQVSAEHCKILHRTAPLMMFMCTREHCLIWM